MRHRANRETPFTVDTDVDLGQAAAPWTRACGGDVRIRRGAVPRALADVEEESAIWQCAGDRLLITLPWGLRFLVEGGERILYAVDCDVDLPSLRLSLLSNPWIALALQRGLLPLHASAVASGAAVHAFTAPSGEGKSTLAAALSTRGHAFFADDVLLLDPAAFDREAQCYGYKDLKLWREGAALAGLRPGKRVREAAGYDKRFVEPPCRSPHTAGRLKGLYELCRRPHEEGGGKPAATVEHLSGRVAVEALHRAVHRRRIARAIVGPRRLARWLATLIPHIDVFSVHRVLADDRFGESVEVVSGALPREEAR